MITLYQIHWSHYVEKVRWALDYKGLEWSAVEIDPFTKHQMRHMQPQTRLPTGHQTYTVPMIQDDSTGASLGESSNILDYLERTYPTPALYPSDPGERNEVTRWMRWLDSTLGLAARRLGYTQIALEQPGFLAELFLPHRFAVGDRATVKARFAGAIIGGTLTRRFRFLHNRADRVFEELEQCLLIAAERMSAREHVVGNRFTAADLTLAALLRPVTVVPFFHDHPRLQRLFAWRITQLQEHHRELRVGYESALHEARRRRGWALGAVRGLAASTREDQRLSTEIPDLPVTRNDQQPLGRWPMLAGPLLYLRLTRTCGLERSTYPT